MSDAQNQTAIPPGYFGRSLEDVVAALMHNEMPYWMRRNKGEKEQWEICFHGVKGAVSPVSVARFYDPASAEAYMIKLTADLLRRIVNGQA